MYARRDTGDVEMASPIVKGYVKCISGKLTQIELKALPSLFVFRYNLSLTQKIPVNVEVRSSQIQ